MAHEVRSYIKLDTFGGNHEMLLTCPTFPNADPQSASIDAENLQRQGRLNEVAPENI